MSPTVADAGPLIALAKIDQFDLLARLFGRIVVPEAVWDEVVVAGEGRPASDETVAARREEWLGVESADDNLAVSILRSTLGAGESEAIVLALQLAADWLLMDDDLARSEAANLGLRVKGTAGILLAAHVAGLLPDLRANLDALQARGVWLGESVYRAVLRAAEERGRHEGRAS